MKGKHFANFLIKSTAFLLTAFLGVSLITMSTQPVSAAQFKDTSGHWAESYINKAASIGIINGYTDGTFRPNASVTRAEFAGMVNRTLGNRGTALITFPDVYSSDWYYNDVAKAVSATYVAGYADGFFRPKDPISRQESAVMLGRIVPSGGSEMNLRSYPDSSSVASWSYDSLAKICGKNYLGPYKNDNKLHPTDPLTRAQTAKILCDIKDRENIVSGDPILKSSGSTLSNKIYTNDVTIHKDLGSSSAYLENCTILGSLNVEGGGSNTVTLTNTRAANCSVNKSSSTVRVMAKGGTTISNLSASKNAILQTSGLSGGEIGKGFANVSLKGSSNITLRGSFPNVMIDGSNAKLLLDSGTIKQLTISSSGRSSDITIPSGSTVTNVDTNASGSFYGKGTIDYMRVNASGVTYEQKPKSVTVSSGVTSPNEDDDDYSDGVRFSPKNKASNVGLNTDITLSFDTSMTLYNGRSISSSDLSDFITIRRDRSNGSTVKFTGSINSSKRNITIRPNSKLEEDTRYYISVDKNSLKDDDGYGNAYLQSYFDTGDSESSSDEPFSPENGDTNVSLDSDIIINFDDEVVRYSNGDTLSSRDSYLEDCIELRFDGSGGQEVPFSATINSSKTTITLDPDSYLEPNRSYYVGIVKNKLKSGVDGKVIPSTNATWQTAGLPVLSNFSATSTGENSLDITGSSNVTGTLYVVAIEGVPPTPPTPAQVASGYNGSGVLVSTRNSVSISGGHSATTKISSLVAETDYTLYGVVKDRAGNISPVVSASGKTAKDYMRSLSIKDLNGFTFSPSIFEYGIDGTLTVPQGTTGLEVTAGGSANSVISSGDIELKNNTPTLIPIKFSGNTGQLKISYQSAPGKEATLYTVSIRELEPQKVVKLSSMRVNANGTTSAFSKELLDEQLNNGIDIIATKSTIYMTVTGTYTDTLIDVSLADNSSSLVSTKSTGADTSFNFSIADIIASGQTLIPINVTLSISENGQIVDSKTYKLIFNYTVPIS